jgi:hypothetical protein
MRQRTQKAAGSPNGGERALSEQTDELARACGTSRRPALSPLMKLTLGHGHAATLAGDIARARETRPRTGGVREIGRERDKTGTGD